MKTKELKQLTYILAEFFAILIIVAIIGACFFNLGRATQSEAVEHPEVERGIAEMRLNERSKP